MLQKQLQRQQHGIDGSLRCTASSRPFVSLASVSTRRSAAPSARQSAPGSEVPPRSRRTAQCTAHPEHTQLQGAAGRLDLQQPLLFSDATGGQVPPSPDLLAEVLPLLTPKQLADAIWGFAKQGSRPGQDVMDAIASEVLTKVEHFGSPDLSNTIWALAVLKYQPSAQWWDAFERQVYQHLTDFNDREAANLMWALAVLDHRPAWVLEPLLSAALDQLHHYSPNALHLIGWSCGKLGYCPSREWLEGYLRAAQASFFQFSPSEMSNIIWALAKLVPGISGSQEPSSHPGPQGAYKLPSLWLDNFLMVAQWRFPSFSAKTLSVVAWAVASLGHTPSQEWLVLYEQQVREKFWDFNGQELACIAWALRRFGASPEHNAVFYMLDRQESFLAVDFEILSNTKLLGQVHQWRHEAASPSSSSTSSSSSWSPTSSFSSASTASGAAPSPAAPPNGSTSSSTRAQGPPSSNQGPPAPPTAPLQGTGAAPALPAQPHLSHTPCSRSDLPSAATTPAPPSHSVKAGPEEEEHVLQYQQQQESEQQQQQHPGDLPHC